jgi:glutamate/tyrosine decarboxylase-like PLP-dependent enzyme
MPTPSYARIQSVLDATPNDALPSHAALHKAASALPASLPQAGLGEEATEAHLLADLVPAFNGPKTSANYYGFVTGGVFPIAEFADHLVTAFDQNVQVHLPDQSISTVVEDRALSALVELLELGPGWAGRTFTTGATGANIVGLACGREAVIQGRLAPGAPGVGELGLLAACTRAGIREVQLLTAMCHSSLYKAASVVGLGRASVKDVGSGSEQPWKIDISLLQQELQREGVASIVALSAGEVNTGRFATSGSSEMRQIRELCDRYGAWLHVDGGMSSLLVRVLFLLPVYQTLLNAPMFTERL